MYIPSYFKVKNVEEVLSFIQTNSFGTLITTNKGKPLATHLPMQIVREEGTCFVTGHMAYGNPQWRTFEKDEEVLVMFQGPHAYISSSWYEKENVPTWNYQAVHLYGTARVLENEELKQDLKALLQKYEKHREDPVLWETLSPQLLENQLKGIVGFKVMIGEIQAAYKLSQNRNETDYHRIIDHLKKEGDPHSNNMAELMKENI